MKSLHRPDLYQWSRFDEARNVDFNAVLWTRPGGNVAIDPLPLTEHDRRHLDQLGGVAIIIITNGDHVRAAVELRASTGARVLGPAAERDALAGVCDGFLSDGDEVVPGLRAFALDGSKTPGELALLLEGSTLITGDLVRAHRAGALMLLPPEKLTDPAAARRSVRRLAEAGLIEAVLVGDGWCVFRDGRARLLELLG